MKLYYYKGVPNFGDHLNPWLWNKLLPGLENDDRRFCLVGIGTLINERLPYFTRFSERRVIFGSGVGYGKGKTPTLDEFYKVYCVRGPLSAKALGLPEELGITDGAALLRNVLPIGNSKKRYSYTYMPSVAWEKACQDIGFGYIDPRGSLEEALQTISETEMMIAEAMHGAIIADAFRIPWIPIVSNSESVLSFKWNDWCGSLGLPYEPNFIERLYHPRDVKDILTPARKVRDYVRYKRAAQELKKVAMTCRPFLSSDDRINDLTERLTEKLEEFKADLHRDPFFEGYQPAVKL